MNSSSTIFFYMYPVGRGVKISGVISTTKCRSLHFDPCIYFLLGRHCKAVLQFRPYLPNIVKFVNVSLIPSPTLPTKDSIDLFIDVLETQCVVIQIGNRVPVFLNLTYSQRGCSRTFVFNSGCETRISTFNIKSSIFSVKGQILDEKNQNSWFSPTSEFSIHHSKENSKLITVCHSSPMETFYHQFQNITSVNLMISMWGRTLNWLDIVIKKIRRVLPFQKYLKHIAPVGFGSISVPRITDFRTQNFSDADILLRLSKLWLNQTSILRLLYNMYLEVRIQKIYLLRHGSILIPQGSYLSVM